MPQCACAVLDVHIEIRIASHIRTRHSFKGVKFSDGRLSDKATCETHGFAEKNRVEWVPQESGVGDGSIEYVARSCFDAAARVWVLQAQEYDAVCPDDFEEGGVVSEELGV